jgi:hypothetical protein
MNRFSFVFKSSVLAWIRIRIRIELKCWIQMWIRIEINPYTIHNPDFYHKVASAPTSIQI